MPQIPVSIITGFLGAGKTTLINHILKEDHGQAVAVIINEYGEESIDHRLVMAVEEDIYQMANGCLCCTLRTDIADMLRSILKAKEEKGVAIDHIIIETTGMADPAPIVQTFFNLPFLKQHFRINGVICLVDSLYIEKQLAWQSEPEKQIAFADHLYLTKTDQVKQERLHEIEDLVRQINPMAPLDLLDLSTIHLDDILQMDAFMMTEEQVHLMRKAQKVFEEEQVHSHCQKSCPHEHDERDRQSISNPSSCDYAQKEEDIDHDHKHHEHDHHTAVVSLAIHEKEPLSLEAIQVWLNELISYYGPQLYRYKGILSVANVPNQIIIQGVQMSFDVSKGRPFISEEDRESTLVLIGHSLPKEELMESFKSTVLGYTSDDPYRQPLDF